MCASRGQLSSAFFFCRADTGRNSIAHLVPTLAYEVIQQIPETRNHICTAISANPHIFKASLAHQIQAIIVQSLQRLSQRSPNSPPTLIIIDGLDECTDKAAQALIIQSLLSSMTSIPTHKILLVSRPESQITAVFNSVGAFTCVERLRLDPWDTQDDICTFLQRELCNIRVTHPLHQYLPTVWPSHTDFGRLSTMAWGSFAYAKLAIRYLSSHDRSPEESIRALLTLNPSSNSEVYAELDALYKHVLAALGSNRLLSLVLQILCLHIYMGEKSVPRIACLLQEEVSMVALSVKRVSSCIGLRGNDTIYLYHTSFEDFLTDQRRSGCYFIYGHDTARLVSSAIVHKWISQLDLDHVQLDQLERVLKAPITGERHRMITSLWEALASTKIGSDYAQENPSYDEIDKACMNVTLLSQAIHRVSVKLSLFGLR